MWRLLAAISLAVTSRRRALSSSRHSSKLNSWFAAIAGQGPRPVIGTAWSPADRRKTAS